jgi:hypothetical protein
VVWRREENNRAPRANGMPQGDENVSKDIAGRDTAGEKPMPEITALIRILSVLSDRPSFSRVKTFAEGAREAFNGRRPSVGLLRLAQGLDEVAAGLRRMERGQ